MTTPIPERDDVEAALWKALEVATRERRLDVVAKLTAALEATTPARVIALRSVPRS